MSGWADLGAFISPSLPPSFLLSLFSFSCHSFHNNLLKVTMCEAHFKSHLLWQEQGPPSATTVADILGLFFFFIFIYLFIYLWLCWVFISVRGLSPVVASGGHSSSRCAGLSLSWPLLLRSTGSRRAGSVIVAHGPSCSVARGILPDQGSNPCPLHWQADSQPLRHQGSPL